MRIEDRICPKCSNFKNVRADFCPQPRNGPTVICKLAVGRTAVAHRHFRCKDCKHKWLEITETRRLNID